MLFRSCVDGVSQSRYADTTINITKIINNTLTITTHQLHHHTTIQQTYNNIPQILNNKQHLKQIFLNLLINTINTLPKNHTTNHTITITITHNTTNTIIIQISNTNNKISPKIHNHIFNPFYTTKTIKQNTKLKLSTTYHKYSITNNT